MWIVWRCCCCCCCSWCLHMYVCRCMRISMMWITEVCIQLKTRQKMEMRMELEKCTVCSAKFLEMERERKKHFWFTCVWLVLLLLLFTHISCTFWNVTRCMSNTWHDPVTNEALQREPPFQIHAIIGRWLQGTEAKTVSIEKCAQTFFCHDQITANVTN